MHRRGNSSSPMSHTRRMMPCVPTPLSSTRGGGDPTAAARGLAEPREAPRAGARTRFWLQSSDGRRGRVVGSGRRAPTPAQDDLPDSPSEGEANAADAFVARHWRPGQAASSARARSPAPDDGDRRRRRHRSPSRPRRDPSQDRRTCTERGERQFNAVYRGNRIVHLCRNYNWGRCPKDAPVPTDGTVCPDARLHACMLCGVTGHPEQNCIATPPDNIPSCLVRGPPKFLQEDRAGCYGDDSREMRLRQLQNLLLDGWNLAGPDEGQPRAPASAVNPRPPPCASTRK